MKARHRTKAIAGVGIWFVILLVYPAVLIATRIKQDDTPVYSGTTLGCVALGALVAQYVSFFWGFHHFAKGKGQSGGLIFGGVLGPPVQFILFLILHSLPDFHAKHELLSPSARTIRSTSISRKSAKSRKP